MACPGMTGIWVGVLIPEVEAIAGVAPTEFGNPVAGTPGYGCGPRLGECGQDTGHAEW